MDIDLLYYMNATIAEQVYCILANTSVSGFMRHTCFWRETDMPIWCQIPHMT